MHRFYWPPDEPAPGTDTQVRGELATHFAASRIEDGETVECFNEKGLRIACRARRDGRRWAITALPGVPLPPVPVPNRRVTVWMAAFDASRFDWAAEKLTELGAAAIGVFRSERSNAQTRNEERVRRLMIRAAEQSGRADLPDHLEAKSLEAVLEDRDVFVLEIPGRTESQPLAAAELPPVLSIVTGPEGGWSTRELELLRSKGVRFVHLVPPVLRAETAAIAAAAIVLSRSR